MSNKVRLLHPLTNRTIVVSEKAARVHRRSGWEDVPETVATFDEPSGEPVDVTTFDDPSPVYGAEFHGPAGAPDEPTPTGVDDDDPGTGEE